jgi:hypothetical protein
MAPAWGRRDHEMPTSLICLLTAAPASKRAAAIISESIGSWFLAATVAAVATLDETLNLKCCKRDGLKGYSRYEPALQDASQFMSSATFARKAFKYKL